MAVGLNWMKRSSRSQIVSQQWHAVSGSGYALAPSVQVTSGNRQAPYVDLVRIDVTFDTADITT